MFLWRDTKQKTNHGICKSVEPILYFDYGSGVEKNMSQALRIAQLIIRSSNFSSKVYNELLEEYVKPEGS